MNIREDIKIERNMLSGCSVGKCVDTIPVTDLLPSYQKPSVSVCLSSFGAVWCLWLEI